VVQPLADARGFHEKAGLCQELNFKNPDVRRHFSVSQSKPPFRFSAIPSSQFLLAASAGSRQGRAKRAVGQP
jgi:hypothetical protein